MLLVCSTSELPGPGRASSAYAGRLERGQQIIIQLKIHAWIGQPLMQPLLLQALQWVIHAEGGVRGRLVRPPAVRRVYNKSSNQPLLEPFDFIDFDLLSFDSV